MPSLRTTERTIISVDSFDLSQYLADVYGRSVEVAACWKSGNDTSHERCVDGTLNEWDEQTLAAFVAGERLNSEYNLPEVLLNDLVRRGDLRAGDYLIEVSW
jgi:hypothetical protein